VADARYSGIVKTKHRSLDVHAPGVGLASSRFAARADRLLTTPSGSLTHSRASSCYSSILPRPQPTIVSTTYPTGSYRHPHSLAGPSASVVPSTCRSGPLPFAGPTIPTESRRRVERAHNLYSYTISTPRLLACCESLRRATFTTPVHTAFPSVALHDDQLPTSAPFRFHVAEHHRDVHSFPELL